MNKKKFWEPAISDIKNTNIYSFMQENNFKSYDDLYKWSISDLESFIEKTISKLSIKFDHPYSEVLNIQQGVDKPKWFKGSKLNIINSCFNADSNSTAIIYQRKKGEPINKISYKELNNLSNRIANGIINLGFKNGDPIAIDMVMTLEAVAIYLGIIKAGCKVVSIAESFSPQEIKTRLRIAKAKAIFTQDYIYRGEKIHSLYNKIIEAEAPKAIIIVNDQNKNLNLSNLNLREDDIYFHDFLSSDENFIPYSANPNEYINILFSSGTTSDPKAIPWNHTTPIKCALDAYFHQDVHSDDIISWPTNIGWMMGPWLIFAALINKACIALYYDSPLAEGFGEFVEKAEVSILGVIPSIVKMWKKNEAIQSYNWNKIRLFSSTGECSNSNDYSFLSFLAGGKPIIEYCGGTEIGGGYITGTLMKKSYPGYFSSPALGSKFYILDEQNQVSDEGELFLVPPALGLSTELLNKDHYEVYYNNTPSGPNGELLRKHGDQIKVLDGYWQGQGRSDDTMNLGGIKISSAEIERVLNEIDFINETAAVAINPDHGGPSKLLIFVVINEYKNNLKISNLKIDDLKKIIQKQIKEKLNPLFKVEEVIICSSLFRTASNKIMRRKLRSLYLEKQISKNNSL